MSAPLGRLLPHASLQAEWQLAGRKQTLSVDPKVVESVRSKLRIPRGVRYLLVTQIMLNSAGIVALIRKIKAGGVPEHMRMDRKR